MNFPTIISPDLNTRAGRMLAAGRVKVTVTSQKTGEHITILFKAFADNRDRQFKENGKNWEPCVYAEATHVFVEVPGASGEWADKVGTYYPRNGRWYDDRNADAARVHAAAIAANWLCGATNDTASCQEESECARCGRELTDPVSIARGIGPICLGAMTGSQHQVKVKEQVMGQQELVTPAPGEVGSRKWLEERTQQILPAVEWAQLEGCSDAEIESMIANLSRFLEKRAFARREAEQERAAYEAKAERDQTFLGR